ncbi:30S ribosomal protein S2 [Candidatus Vidania fulgoroideorum]
MNKIIKKIIKNKINIGHNLNYNYPIEKKYRKKIFNRICIIDSYKILKEIKKLFYFLKIFYKKKRISLFVSTKKNHKNIINFFFKKINFFYKFNWVRGSITNYKLKNKLPDIIFIFDPIKNFSIIKEAKKKSIKVVIFGDSHYVYKNYDFFIPINDDSEKSIYFILNQLYLLLKRIEINKYYIKKNYYFFEYKNFLLKIKKFSDLFLNKKYFNYKIKKLINNLKKKNIFEVKKNIKFLSNFYNEKIKIKGFKKFNNFFLHNNKYLCVSNFNKKKIMINIISNINYIFKNFYYKNLKKIVIKLVR